MEKVTRENLTKLIANEEFIGYKVEGSPFTIIVNNAIGVCRTAIGNVWVDTDRKNIDECLKIINNPTWEFYLAVIEAENILRERHEKINKEIEKLTEKK